LLGDSRMYQALMSTLRIAGPTLLLAFYVLWVDTAQSLEPEPLPKKEVVAHRTHTPEYGSVDKEGLKKLVIALGIAQLL
jgi:hypothetical protein